MNAMTRPAAVRLPTIAEPVLSPGVATAFRLMRDRLYPPAPGEKVGFLASPPDPLPAGGREEARRAAEGLAPLLAPVSEAHFRAWLTPINAVVANPESQDGFAFRAAAMHGLLGDQPAGAFTLETVRQLAGKAKFFPTVAEIVEVIAPSAARIRRDYDALRDLATRQPPAAPSYQPPTAEERANMARQAAEVRAELRRQEEAMYPRGHTRHFAGVIEGQVAALQQRRAAE